MKEEGELYKRLVTRPEQFWRRYAYQKQANENKFYGDFTPKDFIKEILDEAKAEIAHAIYSGTDLELIQVLHKWFGWFGEAEQK